MRFFVFFSYLCIQKVFFAKNERHFDEYMNKVLYHIIMCGVLVLVLAACGQQKPVAEQEESAEAKQLLQGVWLEEDGETPVFQMKGDSVFYADSTSMPARFRVIGDTLYIGSEYRYFIEKHTEHLLWFRNQNGELMKFEKSDDAEMKDEIEQQKPQILSLNKVLKRDTVVFYDSQRYHLYVAINPTRYKVSRPAINEDGMEVENVYYDNIIHLSIFQGSTQLFSRDFRKQQYAEKVPAQILQSSILNNMEFTKVDANGFHFNVSVCVPDDASCYLIDQMVSFSGKPSIKLLEY